MMDKGRRKKWKMRKILQKSESTVNINTKSVTTRTPMPKEGVKKWSR